MRYLAVGDIHIDISNRLEDLKKVLDQIITIAVAYKVKKVLFLGDAFTNRRPYPEEYKILYNWVMELTHRDIQVVLLKGNHDQQKEASTLDAFDILKSESDNIKVVDTNYIEDGIFMGHFIIKEAVFGNSDFHIEDAVTVEQLTTRYPDVRLFLMGDIHKPQQVNENPPIYYIGSIDRNNFGERDNEPRVLLIDDYEGHYVKGYNNVRTTIESIPLKVRPMIQCKFNAEDWLSQDGVIGFPNNFNSAVVKVVISGNEEDLKEIDMMRVREFFKSAHSLVVQYDVLGKEIKRDLEVSESMSDESLLNQYLLKKRDDLLDKEKEVIFEKGKQVILKSKEKSK